MDAAYSDWGAEAGPSTPAAVCGEVATSPFVFAGATHPAGSLSKNCDGSSNPWETLVSGQEAFDLAVDDETVGAALDCMSEAFESGASGLPFEFDNPFAEGSSGSDWPEAGASLGAAARSWLNDSAAAEVSDLGARGLQIVELSKALGGLAGAYGSCAP